LIGLQVHAGHDTRVRFRNLRLTDFKERTGSGPWWQSPALAAEQWKLANDRRSAGPIALSADNGFAFELPAGARTVEVWLTDGGEPEPLEGGLFDALAAARGDASSIVIASAGGERREIFAHEGGHRVEVLLGLDRVAVDVDGERKSELALDAPAWEGRTLYLTAPRGLADEALPRAARLYRSR
jgi:hypothetical protein